MQALDYIKLIWEYNYWAWHKLWDCLATISQEDFERAVDYGIGSLHEHAVHVVWAEALWLGRIKGQDKVSGKAEDYPTLESCVQWARQVESEWRNFIAGLSEEDLDTVFTARASSGVYQHKIGEAMIHMVNHSTDHRAQMLRLIGDYGGQTFEQDIIFYLREKQASQ